MSSTRATSVWIQFKGNQQDTATWNGVLNLEGGLCPALEFPYGPSVGGATQHVIGISPKSGDLLNGLVHLGLPSRGQRSGPTGGQATLEAATKSQRPLPNKLA